MMKRSFLFIAVLMLVSVAAYSQKSKSKTSSSTTDASANTAANDKALKKEWAKKLKALTPLQYKALLDEKAKLQQEITEANDKASQCKDQIVPLQSENDRLKRELEELNAKVLESTAAANTAATANASGDGSGNTASMAGVVYKVQIGAFRNKDLTKYFNNNKNFSGDVDSDGTKKYTLGHFTNYWEADNFKKYLREMGVKDAWIVAYKDGQRVPLKDVLEGVVK